MSSSTANKEISANPGPNSVTSPTDPALKAASVESKMQLYGVVEAFRQGKYPSNAQIDKTLDHVLNKSPIDTSKLSKEGRVLIEDFQDVIRTAKAIVDEKNADELFQNFLWHTRDVDYGKGNLKQINTAVNQDEADRDGQQAAEHLRTLGKLIFTNSEARKLLKDIGILGRDVAADAAAKVSDVARPSEHELARAEEPAPSNQWVGPDGQTRGHNEPVPDTGLAEKKRQAEEAKNRAANAKDDALNQAQGHAENVADAADQSQQNNAHLNDEDRARAAADAGSEQAQEEKQKAADKLKNLKGKIPDIPQEHKDRAREQVDKAKDYAKDKFPQERRDRFIYRLKKVVVENQRHRDYQEAIEFFLDRAENYGNVAADAANQSGGKLGDVRNDSAFQSAERELRTLLERFANGQSSQPIFDAVNQIYTDAKNDQELTNWFKELDSYLRDVLQEPGYILKDACDRRGRDLLDQGGRFWDPKTGKYAGHKDAVFDSVQTFFTAYADDPLNVKLGNDIKKLTTDLLYDSEGNLKYKPHLWNDVREVILPALAKNVGYIPIPRIEYTDNMVDVVIENLTLESQNLLPNIIEVEGRSYFKVSPYDAIKDKSAHSFWLSLSQIQCDLKDVAFYIKKKSGFPKLSDSGLADVFLGGKGVSVKVHLESTGKKNHAFRVVDVKAKVDTLKVNIREAKHSTLISLFKPLAMGLIKKSIQKAIEEGIRGALVQVDAQISDISERVDQASSEEDAGNKFKLAKQAFNDKRAEAEQAKEKVDENKPKGEFKISATKGDQLVDWSSPNSIVDKQGERADAAKAGDGWKSPAFDIVGKATPPAGRTSAGPNTSHPQ
ncbi:hypothetical protein BCR35DRAFT_305540 [Leucosporidium creatinivorum]|uniref:Uncharacterized protein n=1 Tax=Leucosporidium creatinivorum TaxID=106004 RepID=A0A1Y2F169_9BASI|nr:hypothetical protein BCR35DRAFT_305540 [Leucosporidium creatinivorum]